MSVKGEKSCERQIPPIKMASYITCPELRDMLCRFYGIPDDENFDDHEVAVAFARSGITTYQEFVTLQKEELPTIIYHESGNQFNPLVYRRLHMIIACYQWACHGAQKDLLFSVIPYEAYAMFRTGHYNPSLPVVPWRVKIKNDDAKDVSDWKRICKIHTADFKELRDDKNFQKWKETIVTVLTSQNLQHLIDPKYVPRNPEVYKVQSNWMYLQLVNIMQTPMTKKIVTSHQDDRDIPKIWKEICNYMENSMITQINAQHLSTFITSTRLKDCNWRGSQKSFITGFVEKMRLHNKSVEKDEEFTDKQSVNFLNQAVQGVSNLEHVLLNWRTASRAACNNAKIKFRDISLDEYVAQLCSHAEIYDNGRAPKPRQANRHQLVFDDDNDDVLQANTHESSHDDGTGYDDIDQLLEVNNTNIGSSPFQSNAGRTSGGSTTGKSSYGRSGPRRVMMNKDTWDKLSPEEQKAWDTISERGKAAILGYAANNGTRIKRSINSTEVEQEVKTHDLIFDDDNPEDKGDDIPTTTIKTHDLQVAKTVLDRPSVSFKEKESDGKPPPTLMEVAAKSTSLADAKRKLKHYDVRRLMSQAENERQGTQTTETKITNLEIGVHDFSEDDLFRQLAKSMGEINLSDQEKGQDDVEGESESMKSNKNDPRYMKGQFNNVEKPPKLMDQISLDYDFSAIAKAQDERTERYKIQDENFKLARAKALEDRLKVKPTGLMAPADPMHRPWKKDKKQGVTFAENAKKDNDTKSIHHSSDISKLVPELPSLPDAKNLPELSDIYRQLIKNQEEAEKIQPGEEYVSNENYVDYGHLDERPITQEDLPHGMSFTSKGGQHTLLVSKNYDPSSTAIVPYSGPSMTPSTVQEPTTNTHKTSLDTTPINDVKDIEEDYVAGQSLGLDGYSMPSMTSSERMLAQLDTPATPDNFQREGISRMGRMILLDVAEQFAAGNFTISYLESTKSRYVNSADQRLTIFLLNNPDVVHLLLSATDIAAIFGPTSSTSDDRDDGRTMSTPVEVRIERIKKHRNNHDTTSNVGDTNLNDQTEQNIADFDQSPFIISRRSDSISSKGSPESVENAASLASLNYFDANESPTASLLREMDAQQPMAHTASTIEPNAMQHIATVVSAPAQPGTMLADTNKIAQAPHDTTTTTEETPKTRNTSQVDPPKTPSVDPPESQPKTYLSVATSTSPDSHSEKTTDSLTSETIALEILKPKKSQRILKQLEVHGNFAGSLPDSNSSTEQKDLEETGESSIGSRMIRRKSTQLGNTPKQVTTTVRTPGIPSTDTKEETSPTSTLTPNTRGKSDDRSVSSHKSTKSEPSLRPGGSTRGQRDKPRGDRRNSNKNRQTNQSTSHNSNSTSTKSSNKPSNKKIDNSSRRTIFSPEAKSQGPSYYSPLVDDDDVDDVQDESRTTGAPDSNPANRSDNASNTKNDDVSPSNPTGSNPDFP